MATITTGGEGRRASGALLSAVGLGFLVLTGGGYWLSRLLNPARAVGAGIDNVEADEANSLTRDPAAGAASLATSSRERSETVAASDLTKPMDIFGFVVTAMGDRAAGAVISILPRDGVVEEAGKPRKPLTRVVAASDGSFLFTDVPRVALDIVARASDGLTGFAALDTIWFRGGKRLGPLSLVTEAGATIEGRIVGIDSSNASSKKLTVWYECVRRGATGGSAWFDVAERAGLTVKMDESGRFVLTGVPQPALGSLHIVARGTGLGGWCEVPSSPWPPRPVEIPLVPDRECSGKVVNSEHVPLTGARIAWARGSVLTDGEGRFRFRLDPRDWAAPLEALVSAEGYAWTAGALDTSGAVLTSWTLERGASVRGVVQSNAGSPAAGAWVSIEGQHFLPGKYNNDRLDRMFMAARIHEFETRVVRADAEGAFTLQSLPPEPLLLSAGWPGLPGIDTPHVSRPPESGVVLVLTPAPLGYGTIEGRVIDGRTRASIPQFNAMVVTDWGTLRALTVADGTFRIDRCPAGTWRLRVVPGPGAAFSPVERWIGLDVDETIRDFFVEVSGRGRTVLTFEEPPAKDVVLALSPIEGEGMADPPIAESRADGPEVSFEDLPPGVYGIHAVKGTLAVVQPARVRVESGRTAAARVSLTTGRALFVVVKARDGEASVAPYGVRVRDGAGGFVVFDKRPGTQRILSGAGASAVLPPGKYWVSIDRKDQTVAEQEVTVPREDGTFAAFEIRADDK